MGWLDNKVALITGAGAGIGKAVATRFLEEGAKGVVAVDIFEDRLAALRTELGKQVVTVCGDVRSPADNRNAVNEALSSFGKLDVFVGNAGIRDARRRLVNLADTEIDEGFDEVFAVNVKGYLLGAAAAREPLARSHGCIVFTLSSSSFYVGGGAIYTASKHAALGLTRALANELAPDIRVNGVAPSGTPTSLANAESLSRPGATGVATSGRSGGPDSNILGLAFKPEDHAAAYVYLASDQSRVVSGVVINTDGGRGVTTGQTG